MVNLRPLQLRLRTEVGGTRGPVLRLYAPACAQSRPKQIDFFHDLFGGCFAVGVGSIATQVIKRIAITIDRPLKITFECGAFRQLDPMRNSA